MFIYRVGFIVILTLVTIAFFAVVTPFYSAVLWAVIFAIIFFPVHARIERGLGNHRNFAALASVMACLCLVIVPGLVVLTSLVAQASQIYQRVESGDIDLPGLLKKLEDALPLFVREHIESVSVGGLGQLPEGLASAVLGGGSFFAGRALSLGQSTLAFFLSFGIMLYLLFFLFRDGRVLSRMILRAVPLSDDHTRQFAAKFTSTVRATVRGNVIIAVVQGLIGGIAFWALDLQPALLWGVAMSLLSLLPAVGAALIWIPAAVYLALLGMWWQAVVLTLVGVFVIGLVDNLLRPPLVGQETKLPDYVVLISTLGGIALIGINGFVVGPMVAALFMSAWSIFVAERQLPGDKPKTGLPWTQQ
ncbi:AI-2E family transporter [Shinella sp. NM-101]|uniref:AI-2E family transporter n=1 Tax=Shinella sp. NM-101 TaxID=2744455 RepID=UPI001F3075AD|nr:AI-2E family transporter [Shinella sp. NM-101]